MVYATVFVEKGTEVDVRTGERSVSVTIDNFTLHGPPGVVRGLLLKALNAVVDATGDVVTT